MAGIDLGEVSRCGGPLRIADACEVIRQAAEGLQYAHEHGLIHRDLKPSNLILAVSDQRLASGSERSARGRTSAGGEQPSVNNEIPALHDPAPKDQDLRTKN